jgi:intracellular septation protein A
MAPTDQSDRHLHGMRRDAAVRLLVNALAPFALYALLIHFGVSDFMALAAAAAIPAVWTVGLWLWRRRLDWIGLFAVLVLAVELAVAALLGGNTFLLKTRAAVLTGPLGIVLLVSALIGRPLLLPLLQWMRPAAMERSGALARLSHDAAAHRKIAQATAVLGAVLFVHAAIAITLALTLSSESFLIASKAANWIFVGIAVGALWLLRRAKRHSA